MRTQLRSRRYLLAVACLSMTSLVACGKGSGEDQAAANDPNSGPLGELMGYNSDPAEQRKQQLQQEEAVAVCMKDAGYEYTPVDYTALQPEGANEQFDNPVEFAKKYGYGIAYNYNLYERPGAQDGSGIDAPPDQAYEDPNWTYQQTLSESEQMAYQTALYGDQSAYQVDPSDSTEATEYVPPPLEEQGCYGKAQQEVMGDQLYNNPDVMARLNDMYEQMQNEPRIEDAMIVWSDCVYAADANWDFFTPDEIYSYFEGTKSTLQGLRRVEINPETGEPLEPLPEGEYVNWSTQDADGNSYGYAGEPKEISQADLDEMQKEEIDLYNADQKCQKDADLIKIRKEVEQEMVDTLTSEFPEIANKGS
jgi:hypothetical protein